MGKPSPSTAPPEAEALSLHSRSGQTYYDSDAPELPTLDDAQNDDLPPLYDEAHETGTSLSASLLAEHTSHLSSVPTSGLGAIYPFRTDDNITYYLYSPLDTNPELLEQQVRAWALTPPRPFVRIYGYHRERRHPHDKKKENRDVTDFDIKVDLTPYLGPASGSHLMSCDLQTVENQEKTRRGTSLRRRAPGMRKDNPGRIELGMLEKPSLTHWCHMYCASHAGLKTFQLRRRVEGFDEQRVRAHLEGMVRRTNYRGHVRISFPVDGEKVEVWNDCRTNRWRLTTWIYGLFCVTMLWLLTWPYLFFRTKRFEVVTATWFFSVVNFDDERVYATISEDQWYNLWGRALTKAVLMKRQGTLDQQDLLAAEGAPPSFNTGNAAVDGTFSILAAGVNAMNEVNRQLGWGEDHF